MSVLVHDDRDIVRLSPPDAVAYENWAREFLDRCAERLGPKTQLLADRALCALIAGILRHNFEQTPVDELILRNWTKMAGFAPAVLLSHEEEFGADELVELVDSAARQVAGEMLPWDD